MSYKPWENFKFPLSVSDPNFIYYHEVKLVFFLKKMLSWAKK
jgi:hypothetical protein